MATLTKTAAGYSVLTKIPMESRMFQRLRDAQAHYRKVDTLERKKKRR